MKELKPGTKVIARFSDQNGQVWCVVGTYLSRNEYIAQVELEFGDGHMSVKGASYEHLIPLGPVGELLFL